MKLTRLLSMACAGVTVAVVGSLEACGSFGNDETGGLDADADAGTTGDGPADAPTSRPACTMLTPRTGPPPLHPEGGPPETDCDGKPVDLETSNRNCGACGNSCGGAGCVGGVCEKVLVLASSAAELVTLYEQRGQLVVTTDFTVATILSDGGGARTIADIDAACCVTASPDGDSDWIFRSGPFPTWQAERVAAGGGVSGSVTLSNVGLTSNATFVTTADDFVHIEGLGAARMVMANRKGDGMSRILAKEPFAYGLVNAGGFLLWSHTPSAFNVAGEGSIVRYDPATTETQRSLPNGVTGAVGHDADYVYYFDGGLRELRRLPIRTLTTAPSETLATWTGPENHATGMVVQGDYIYAKLAMVSLGTRVIVRVDRCGSAPVVVARSSTGNMGPGPVFLDNRLHYADFKALYSAPP